MAYAVPASFAGGLRDLYQVFLPWRFVSIRLSGAIRRKLTSSATFSQFFGEIESSEFKGDDKASGST
jgi:hypothetical protein